MAQKAYGKPAIVIHWLLAVSIFFLFISSWWMLALPLPSDEFTYRVIPFQLHKNVGMTLFIILTMLLYIRLKHRPEPDVSLSNKPVQRKLAIADHVLLYGLIAACCISGYMSSSYSGWDTSFWWIVNLPSWGYEDDRLNIFYSDIHLWACWALLAVMAIHISAALYHGFSNDGVIKRMTSFD